MQEIKSAIERLSLEERAELIAELCGWADDDWDRQMNADAEAGKFATLNNLVVEGSFLSRFGAWCSRGSRFGQASLRTLVAGSMPARCREESTVLGKRAALLTG